MVPHDEVLDKRPALHRRIRKSDEKVKIVILGVLSLHKGANVVRGLIKEIKEHKLPIEIVLIGYSQEVIESHGVFKETG